MLVVESYSPGGKDPDTRSASRVLIMDAFGNPLVLAAMQGTNLCLVAHHGDDDWERLLAQFNIKPAAVRLHHHIDSGT